MTTKNEAIQFDGKGASFAKYLNEDVRLIVESTGKQVDNIVEMVNQVNLDKDVIRAYCDEFASVLKANGKDDNTVKALKSARKCILDFSCGLRKGQEDQTKWTGKYCKMMLNNFVKDAGSINSLAKLCREAVQDEQPDELWDFVEKFNKLLEKAADEGTDPKVVADAMQQALEIYKQDQAA